MGHCGSTRSANSASHPDSTVAKRGSQRNAWVVIPGDHRARPARAVPCKDEGAFMKRSGTGMAVGLSAMFAAIGCNDYGHTFQVPTGATITSLSPANATAGSPQFTLTVVGGVFVAKTVVQWNGGTIATQVQTDSAAEITGTNATPSARAG